MKSDGYVQDALVHKSLPTRECGLKFVCPETILVSITVTPYAGVWIEIHDAAIPCIPRSRSLPTRECGLKLYLHFQDLWLQASLPTRECGLKFDKHVSGVGIKTSLPTRECGLKSYTINALWIPIVSLPTRECGLKFAGKTIKTNIGRHSLRGSVD